MIKTMTLLMLAAIAAPATAQSAADRIAAKVWNRPANEGRVGVMQFQLISASGSTRQREALMLHSDRPDAIRIAIFFQKPAALTNTAFLSHDYRDKADDTWLFLPATERVRRIPQSQRSDAFLGTDLSYGDIKDNFRFSPEDWAFAGGEQRMHQGKPHIWLTGRAKSPAVAKETGYGAFRALIDPVTLFPAVTEYDDREGKPAKRVEVLETREIGGAWTAMRFTAQNLNSGHQTQVRFANMRHVPGLPVNSFLPDRLPDGPPALR